MRANRSLMTSVSSRFYDSRLVAPGIGYPSCNTELCRIPSNRADPHGYYAELGVPPWATPEEIRSSVRRLYRRLHPDTGSRPDTQRLQRVKMIAEVLLDPEERDRYDRTPPGKRLLDAVYRAELTDLGVLAGMTPDEISEALRPVPADGPSRSWFYDYLSVDHTPWDVVTTGQWYSALLAVAPIFGYRRRIKVLLHDGPPFFHAETAVMAVPRSWEPSTLLAYALFAVAADIVPGTSRRR